MKLKLCFVIVLVLDTCYSALGTVCLSIYLSTAFSSIHMQSNGEKHRPTSNTRMPLKNNFIHYEPLLCFNFITNSKIVNIVTSMAGGGRNEMKWKKNVSHIEENKKKNIHLREQFATLYHRRGGWVCETPRVPMPMSSCLVRVLLVIFIFRFTFDYVQTKLNFWNWHKTERNKPTLLWTLELYCEYINTWSNS